MNTIALPWMKLTKLPVRRRLQIYLIVLHCLFLGLSIGLYHQQPLLMVALELLLLCSLTTGLYLVGKLLQPLDYTRRFQELLQDQNYAAQLHIDSDDETQALVVQFNHMLKLLYQERLQLGEQQGFLDRLLEATPSAVVVFDFDGRISLLNASAQTLLGIARPQGQSLAAWIDGNGQFNEGLDHATCARARQFIGQLNDLPQGAPQLLIDSDGRRYRVQRSQFFDRGFARAFLLIEELTETLESSEKATYEKLVRVLAHEVNNTVAATGSVLDSLLFYREQLRSDDAVDFQTAIEAVKRRNISLGEFIERFTRVVKMPEPVVKACDLNELLGEMVNLYREPCRRLGLKLEWTPAPTLPKLALDRALMAQALLNIIKNAMEAAATTMHEQKQSDGFIRIEVLRETLISPAHDGSATHMLGQHQHRIRLSISDSGNRLYEVPAGQLFTPFFTTKKGGQGIGLLFVREVLHRHGLAHRLAPTRTDTDTGATRFDIWFAEP